MKLAVTLLFLALSITAFSNSANATCTQSENQFFGVVRNVKQFTNLIGETWCTYQVTVNGTPSGVCPLSNGDAEQLVLLDAKCEKKNGDNVSGVLVTKSWIE